MATDASQPTVATIGLPSEVVGLDSSGKAVEGLRVPFKTAKGIDGTVFIPGQAISQDRIIQAVRERAVALDLVANTEVT